MTLESRSSIGDAVELNRETPEQTRAQVVATSSACAVVLGLMLSIYLWNPGPGWDSSYQIVALLFMVVSHFLVAFSVALAAAIALGHRKSVLFRATHVAVVFGLWVHPAYAVGDFVARGFNPFAMASCLMLPTVVSFRAAFSASVPVAAVAVAAMFLPCFGLVVLLELWGNRY